MRARVAALTLGILVAGWSCTSQAPATVGLSDADKASINQARDAFMTAFNGGDLEHLYDSFSQDHVTAPPNGPAMSGAELRNWHRVMLDQNTVQGTFGPADLVGAGDLAIDRYDYSLTVTPKAGGTPIVDRGKGLWIWRRAGDGSWKLSYAIWNSDLPVSSAQ